MEDRVSDLQIENEKLRGQLQSQADLASLKHMEVKIEHLLEENDELKAALHQLQHQLESVNTLSSVRQPSTMAESIASAQHSSGHDAEMERTTTADRLDALRHRINDMASENEDLKGTIARLRWSSNGVTTMAPPPIPSPSPQLDMDTLQAEFEARLAAEKEEAIRWRRMYEETERLKRQKSEESSRFQDWWRKLDMSAIFGEGSTTMESGARLLDRAFSAILDGAARSEIIIPESISRRLDEARNSVLELHERLSRKWDEMMRLNESVMGGGAGAGAATPTMSKIKNKMADLLDSSFAKIEELGKKLTDGSKPLEARVDKVTSKLLKLAEGLESKWSELKGKLSNRVREYITTPPPPSDPAAEEEEEPNAEADVDGSWYLERGSARRRFADEQKLAAGEGQRNWMLERAQDRELMRIRGVDVDEEETVEEEEEEPIPVVVEQTASRAKVNVPNKRKFNGHQQQQAAPPAKGAKKGRFGSRSR